MAPGPDRQNIWASRGGRRTDARLGHGVVTTHSPVVIIIVTTKEVNILTLFKKSVPFLKKNGFHSVLRKSYM
ncbi:hypothetical protein HMPREF0083_05626 [Aneurinibacillus aneurinilyticus ATCC 12856]|uniref:Uncharacterized protein n=1 Tax=Aneurinibacillus aneurinilyticus ATCC 12856 TaxID=649747 RepID=U1Y3Y6_ANEAE|nr:hypothetical protein HMPREF0083_05626 [Aneurinibacillus aneurinilyticus ATCC 12856]